MQTHIRLAGVCALALGLGGCAGMVFHDGPQPGALSYYDGKPYLLVTVAKDCTYAATVVSLPAVKRSVGFKSGLGTADLSLTLQNGMITTIGQKTDTQIPQTLTAIAGLATAGAKFATLTATPAPTPTPAKPASICQPTAELFEIVDGVPAATAIKSFEAKVIVDPSAATGGGSTGGGH